MKILLIIIAIVIGGVALWWGLPDVPSTTDSIQTQQETKNAEEKETQGLYESSLEKAQNAKEALEKKSGAVLDLSGQGLTKAPTNIFENTALVELNLSNNKLGGSLQAEIRLLQNLKSLDLSSNNFTGVPAEIGQLKNLEVLNLSNNNLTGLPYELGNLSKLKVLDLRGNAYSEADLTIIKKSLPASTIIKTN